MRTRNRSFVAAVAVLAMGLVASACSVRVSAGTFPAKPSGLFSTTTTSTSDDVVVASGLQLQPGDLPTGWSLAQSDVEGDDTLHSPDSCFNDPHVADLTAAIRRTYVLNRGFAGQVELNISLASSADAQQARRPVFASAIYEKCEIKGIEAGLLTMYPGGIVKRTDVSTTNVELPVAGINRQFKTIVNLGPIMKDQLFTSDDYILFVGRAKAHFSFHPCGCADTFTPDLEQALINKVAGRMKALADTPNNVAT